MNKRKVLPRGRYRVVKLPEQESCFLSNCRITERDYPNENIEQKDERVLSLRELYERGAFKELQKAEL